MLLPHDYLSAHLSEPGTAPFTDRGDASGTGYYSTAEDRWRPELVRSALLSRAPTADGTGTVTGFADAQHGWLPMTVTLNAPRILDLQARLLGVHHDELADLALQAPPGAG